MPKVTFTLLKTNKFFFYNLHFHIQLLCSSISYIKHGHIRRNFDMPKVLLFAFLKTKRIISYNLHFSHILVAFFLLLSTVSVLLHMIIFGDLDSKSLIHAKNYFEFFAIKRIVSYIFIVIHCCYVLLFFCWTWPYLEI